MLDGLRKGDIDRLWNALARPLARAGITPNQVTWTGLALVALHAHPVPVVTVMLPVPAASLTFEVAGLIA